MTAELVCILLTLTPIDFRAIPIHHVFHRCIARPRAARHCRPDAAPHSAGSERRRSGGKTTGRKCRRHGPCLCAGDIEERVQLSQPTISHHMAILTKAGLVEATKKDNGAGTGAMRRRFAGW